MTYPYKPGTDHMVMKCYLSVSSDALLIINCMSVVGYDWKNKKRQVLKLIHMRIKTTQTTIKNQDENYTENYENENIEN